MSNTLKLINNALSNQRNKYLNDIKLRSSICEKASKERGKYNFVPNKRDLRIMMCRDISKIDNKKINARQKKLKVDLIMFTFYYIALICLLFNTLYG